MFNKVISFSLLNCLTLIRCYKSSSSLSPKVHLYEYLKIKPLIVNYKFLDQRYGDCLNDIDLKRINKIMVFTERNQLLKDNPKRRKQKTNIAF